MLPESDSVIHDIRAILFDLDGTLADTIPLILASHRHATQAVLGEALPDSILLSNLGRPLAAQMELFDTARAEELLAAYREHNAAHHDSLIREYPAVRDAIVRLARRGYMMGVVTSKSRDLASRSLAAVGMGGLFEVVVGLEDTARHKPDPEPVLEGLRRLDVPAAEAAYVGDSPFDMEAGTAAGVRAVGVTWGPFDAAQLRMAGADLLATSPGGLLEVFPDRGGDEAAPPDRHGLAGCNERSGAA